MARSKFFNKGDITRNSKCELCDRQFIGDKRNVEKIIQMHYKKTHDLNYDIKKERDQVSIHVMTGHIL